MATPTFKKPDPSVPAFAVTKGKILRLRSGVSVMPKTSRVLTIPKTLAPGADYGIQVIKDVLKVAKLSALPKDSTVGGFHVGLDGKINPHSIWDTQYRPCCPDPRAMARVPSVGWVDIYLLNTEPHLHGTSAAGKQIADGWSEIQMPDGSKKPLTWWNAVTVLSRYGKQLLSRPAFEKAMHGVEIGKNHGTDPEVTGHAPGLKSVYGIEQATGCMWTWSSDIYTAEYPWVYILGGSWNSSAAGPRRSIDGDPDDDWYSIGARGRCDHLSPEESEAKA